MCGVMRDNESQRQEEWGLCRGKRTFPNPQLSGMGVPEVGGVEGGERGGRRWWAVGGSWQSSPEPAAMGILSICWHQTSKVTVSVPRDRAGEAGERMCQWAAGAPALSPPAELQQVCGCLQRRQG